jgi:hypothetical protein
MVSPSSDVESRENFIRVRIIEHGLQSMGTYLNFLEGTDVYTDIISTQTAATLRFWSRQDVGEV